MHVNKTYRLNWMKKRYAGEELKILTDFTVIKLIQPGIHGNV
jgi:hypothetical protein